MSERIIVRAAAGTGKTTELTRRYLSYLKEHEVGRIVAITFTRKAAAELLERVSRVLWAASDADSQQKRDAKAALPEAEWRIYAKEVKHLEDDRIMKALADLPNAPVGTTDSFVRALLAEFALDAALPVEGGEPVMLDFPLEEGGADRDAILEEEARKLLTDDAGFVSERQELLKAYTLGEVVRSIATPVEREAPAMAPATLEAVYRTLGKQVFAKFEGGIPKLRELLEPFGDLPVDRFETEMVRQDGRPFARAVWQWLQTPKADDPFAALLGFLGTLQKRNEGGQFRKQLIEYLGDETALGRLLSVELYVGRDRVGIPLSKISNPDSGLFLLGNVTVPLERCRKLFSDLRREVSRRGDWRLAMDGALGYDECLEAAIHLCEQAKEDPGHPLRSRFNALLVDEVQDSNPRQMVFYRAFAEAGQAMDASFVGDTRQSIYLFRDADPTGLESLKQDLGASDGFELKHNWRSTANLVTAHRALFSRELGDRLDDNRFKGLADLSGLEAGRKDKGLDRPVRIIVGADKSNPLKSEQADTAALVDFAVRMHEVWMREKPGSRQSTAAVLCPKWSMAKNAAALLNTMFQVLSEGKQKEPFRAYVDRSDDWKSSRVVQDLRILIAALLDRSDQTAWLGVWKLPPVGLSDHALAHIRMNKGIDDKRPWLGHLGWVADAKGLKKPIRLEDQAAFGLAAPVLREAIATLSARPLADVLDDMATALCWRDILRCDPDDEAIYYLDHTLEWIRDLEAAGMSPREVLDYLAGDVTEAEAPNLAIHRTKRHVSCTTVFQAKGLKWDHVCVLAAGTSVGKGDRRKIKNIDMATKELFVSIDKKPFRLFPVRMDPSFALEGRKTDPVGRLVSAIESRRVDEETVRMVYVAITRAAESVRSEEKIITDFTLGRSCSSTLGASRVSRNLAVAFAGRIS